MTVTRVGDESMIPRVTQPRQIGLLLYLLLERPQGLHARDSVLPLLWPEHDETRARQALRNALHGLRQLLGADVITSAGDHLIGVDYAMVTCDALEIEEHRLATEPPVALDALSSTPFAGFHVARAPKFDSWLEAVRSRLVKLQSRALARRPPTTIERSAAGKGHAPRGSSTAPPHGKHAYEYYVRGNYMFVQAVHNGRFEDLDRSRECFERALALDPHYAVAIAGLANYFAVAGRRGVIQPFHAAFGRAIELSHEALALDDTLAVPHVHFGVKALYLDDDVPTALTEFATAAALDPQYAESRRFHGIVLGLIGERERGLAELEVAAALETDVPMYNSALAAALVSAGDVTRAEALFRAALRVDPSYGAARERLLRLLEYQQRFQDAVAERSRTPTKAGAERFHAAWLADGAAGYRRERATELRLLVTLIESRLAEGEAPSTGDLFDPPAIRLALAYAELGDWNKARAWKLQGCAERPGLAPRFAAEPTLQPLFVRR